MTQYGNINLYTDKQRDIYSKTSSAGNDNANVKEYASAGNIDELLGYKYSKEKTPKANSTMENFEEYMKQQQEKAREAGMDEAAKEKEEKEAEKEIANNLTHEEIKRLSMMGIDVENARLSDIMGMVNTIRGEAKRQESAELMAKIAVSGDDVDGLMVSGGTVKQAGTGIEIDSVDVLDVARAIEEEDTKELTLTKEDVAYLIKNDLELTKDNLYKAHFSGIKLESGNDELYKSMKPQLDKVIEQAGYEVSEETEQASRFLLDNDLLVTTDNLRKYMSYSEEVGKDSSKITFSSEVDINKAASKLFADVALIDDAAVYEMSKKGMEITIASAASYGKNRGEFIPDGEDISSLRKLEEIRLSMTLEAATRLVKSDINIDTRELSNVVAKLKELEQSAIADTLHRNGIKPTAENIALVSDINEKVGSIAKMPAAVIAAPLKGYEFNVNKLTEVAKEETAKQTSTSFEKAARSYEAVGTQVRTDMGDSITKAFRNVDDILASMELPVNYENQRAVRILGYNQLDITAQSIEDIVSYDRQVNELIENFYPEAVMGMIKDGINPLDVSIEDLNQVIRERNYNAGVSEAANFATYLRDVEAQGEITPEERESYIGIYRAMTKLAKSGDREAGWLYSNGSKLTVRNLITAMRSRKASGIDLNVDDNFGMLEETLSSGKKIDSQIESAFSVPQEALDAINDEMTVEFAKAENIELTMVNAKAIYAMVNKNGGIYELASEILMKMKFESDVKEDAIDEETENMADSMTGEDVAIDIMPESILENLLGSEEMSLKYEDLRDQMIENMYEAAQVGIISSVDISAIKTVAAGFNILSGMAKNEKYQIPYETENGISVMNLTMKHDASNKGSIEIDLDVADIGNVKASLSLLAEGTISGSITASTSDGNNALMGKAEELISIFASHGYDAGNISFGQISANAGAQDKVENKQLYQAAVAAVKVLSKI